MALTETQKQIADRIAHLLAESPLDEEIKKTILDGLDKLPEHLIFQLQKALEGEREELQRVALDLELFLQDQQKDWQKLEQDQKDTADKIINKHVQKIEDDINLRQLQEKINQ
jgi:mannitol-1-phosphate/altronate dehydrogenase